MRTSTDINESHSKKRAVGYTRVSTDEQETRLLDDRRRITAACVTYDFELVDFIQDEGVSGSVALAERDNGKRVHQLIESRKPFADVLIVSNLDRLTRKSEDGMALIERFVQKGRRNPVVLISLDEHIDLTGSMGRFFARLHILMGEHEREQIGERTSNALQHKRRNGLVYSPKQPYGWDSTDDGRLVANAAEQRVIEHMRTWRADGFNDNQIATRLNGLDIKGKRGGRWQANTVFRILKTADEVAKDVSS